MEFHHVGVATPDAHALASTLDDLLGLRTVHEERFETLRVVFLGAGAGYVELLEPVDSGTVARYLDRDGPGIHHVAFATPDVARGLERALVAGATAIDDEPRPGAWGHRVAFLHPESTGGVLVELVEEAA